MEHTDPINVQAFQYSKILSVLRFIEVWDMDMDRVTGCSLLLTVDLE